MSAVPALVKKGWHFVPYWSAAFNTWHITALKKSWDITHTVKHADWDEAHRLAACWAEQEESFINEERPTIPAPAMEAAE
ncbi:MAG TPA: hypothetical protein VM686_10230 [Polyangiaceae bacterium]|jgi:hypothetical protein|nr:hypothetical protein [Polyangiaceae bacterium]